MAKPSADRAMTATCEVWTNPFGWELRFMIGRGMPLTSGRGVGGRIGCLGRDVASRIAGDRLELGKLLHEQTEALSIRARSSV
jgi:hypothetical protein